MLEQLIQHLREVFHATDGLIVLDQINEPNWGVVHEQVRTALVELHRDDPGKLIYVDSRQHLGRFTSGVLKGNRAEILRAVESRGESYEDVVAGVRRLADRNGSPCFCTMGDEGILVADPGREPELIAGRQVPGPIDIVGAGDAATSGIVSTLLSGGTLTEAASMGNLVASITVQKLGTTGTASPDELLAAHR